MTESKSCNKTITPCNSILYPKCTFLTLKWSRYSVLNPLVVKGGGGVPIDPNSGYAFPEQKRPNSEHIKTILKK